MMKLATVVSVTLLFVNGAFLHAQAGGRWKRCVAPKKSMSIHAPPGWSCRFAKGKIDLRRRAVGEAVSVSFLKGMGGSVGF